MLVAFFMVTSLQARQLDTEQRKSSPLSSISYNSDSDILGILTARPQDNSIIYVKNYFRDRMIPISYWQSPVAPAIYKNKFYKLK